MPLTPEEQAELAQLHAKYAPQPQSGGLSPDEQAELAQLHQKYGGVQPDQSGSLLDSALSKAKSFAAGAGQGLTLGNVGNIGGAVQTLASYLGKPGQTDRDLEAQGFKIQQPSAFDVGKQATNDALDKEYQENPWAYRAGYAGGSLPLAGPGKAIAKAAGGGMEGAAALGGVQGYLHDYDVHNPDEQLWKGAAGMAGGAATNKLFNYLSGGLDKGEDALMQQATNIRKDFPIGEQVVDPDTGEAVTSTTGVGNKLKDLGIGGSRNAMKQQVAAKLGEQEKTLQGAASKMDTTGTEELLQLLKSKQQEAVDPVTGTITDPDKYNAYAQGIKAYEGSNGFSGPGMLQMKRGADWASRGASGNVLDSLPAQVKADAANWARGKIYDSGSDAYNALQNQRALLIAKQALDKNPMKPKLGLDLPSLFAGASTFGATHNPLYSLGAIAASKAAQSPAVQSAGAKVLGVGADAAEKVAEDPAVQTALFNTLFGATDSPSTPPKQGLFGSK